MRGKAIKRLFVRGAGFFVFFKKSLNVLQLEFLLHCSCFLLSQVTLLQKPLCINRIYYWLLFFAKSCCPVREPFRESSFRLLSYRKGIRALVLREVVNKTKTVTCKSGSCVRDFPQPFRLCSPAPEGGGCPQSSGEARTNTPLHLCERQTHTAVAR